MVQEAEIFADVTEGKSKMPVQGPATVAVDGFKIEVRVVLSLLIFQVSNGRCMACRPFGAEPG